MAVCDVSPEQMEKSLTKHHLPEVPRYVNLQQMLDAHPEIESVHVCTPSGNHMEPVLTALAAGRNVVCEKPMEIQLDRIDRMIEAADQKGVRLAGIFQNRWDDANRALKTGRRSKIASAPSPTAGATRPGIAPTNTTATAAGAAPGSSTAAGRS